MKTSDLYQLFTLCGEISTDSRHGRGLFFALRGDRFDGNDFAAAALDSGARYAVVDRPEVAHDERYIVVEDSLQAMQDLALYHRQRLDIPIVALTGSNGKTTTKELITRVLSTKMVVGATKGNFNNHIGVPLTLLSFDGSTQIGVVEMGANHPGEIAALCAIARPNYGLITNIGLAHLDGFGSPEGVRLAKGELFDFLLENSGTALCNVQDSVVCSMVHERQGLKNMIFDKPLEAVDGADSFLKFSFDNHQYSTYLVGHYNISNILLALAVGRFFGVDSSQALEAICTYEPANHRSQVVHTSGNTLYVDAYNANPSSMRASIENFARLALDHKCVILGDMFELGLYAASEHQALVDWAASQGFEQLFLVGENFGRTNSAYPKFADREALCEFLLKRPLRGKNILLKGSHSVALERVIEVL
ncbi:MAG: UDP-N-acetylmuramoyl-tripeptide--D-alanyl-D-alanine ligase [Mucinivorans sp.]